MILTACRIDGTIDLRADGSVKIVFVLEDDE